MRIMLAILLVLVFVSSAFAEIKYISPYRRSDGTYVSGHYKDTSADGNPYNNRGHMFGY